jgi:hypothetical protein
MEVTIATAEIIEHSRAARRKVDGLAREVLNERFRQIRKWGPQTHPSGTSPNSYMAGRSMKSYAAILKAWNDERADNGEATWAPILLEEIFEAMESDDIQNLRTELIQSMAVIAAWIEDIDAKGHL